MTSGNHAPGAHHHYTEAELHNEDVSHEHSDVDVQTVLSFGVGLALVVLITATLAIGMMRMFESQAASEDPQVSPVARPAGQSPPAPNLLTNEPAGLRKFEAEEAKVLEGYGWVNQQGGVARVPIDQAKKLLVARGLPVRAAVRLRTRAPARMRPLMVRRLAGGLFRCRNRPPPRRNQPRPHRQRRSNPAARAGGRKKVPHSGPCARAGGVGVGPRAHVRKDQD
jgi:hypothetical protein